jgi:SAM-dependent methyltransferase
MNKYLSELYGSNKYLKNTGGWCPEEDVEKFKTIQRVLGARLNSTEIRSVLDVGCGTGHILSLVKGALGAETYCEGIDFSDTAIAIANENNSSENLMFSTRALHKIDQEYDLVIVSHVLEHVMDWDLFLKEVSRVSGKFIYVNVPLEANVLNILRGNALKGTYQNYGHIHFFDENFVVQYLKDCDFEIVSQGYGEEFRHANSTGRGVYARLPRILLGLLSKSFTVRTIGGYSLGLLLKAA